MNHSFYLSKMPQVLRAGIEAQPVYAPWLRQGETLASVWSSPAIMEAVYNLLTDREKKVLKLIVVSIGSEPFDWARLERACLHVMSGAEAKVGFLLLLKKGLVYMFRKTWGEHVYVLADDALALWQQLLLSGSEDNVMLISDKKADSEFTDEPGAGLAGLLFQTLVFIGRNDIRLTKNGTLHKKQLQKWLDLLSGMDDELFRGNAFKYAFADVYPAKLAVMMEFLLRLRLMEQSGEQLILNETALRSWLSYKEDEQTKLLYSVWKQSAFPVTAWLQHAALLLERQPQGVWWNVDGLLQWLRKHNIIGEGGAAPDERNGLVEQLEQQWLQPLIAFGWIEKRTEPVQTGGGIVSYRWRIQPLADAEKTAAPDEADERFYVQPDFELLVPPDVPFDVRWELSAIADLLKPDQVSVYKLSKESLQRGLESGRTLEAMLQFLERNSLYGIPDNVKLTLEQWAKPFGKIQLAEVLLLRCADTETAEALGKLPGCADCLFDRVGELAWLIRADQYKRLTELLEKAGWMPGPLRQLGDPAPSGRIQSDNRRTVAVPEVGTEQYSDLDNVSVKKPVPIAEKGFLYTRQPFIYFEMEPKIPEIQELYPDLQGVPQGWMKDYRAYHTSTRREMVEKALEWKTALQLRYNGRDQVIAPRKLQETRGTWSMTGLEQSQLQEICLFPEDWQEMRMIVPGINDKY